MCPYFPPKKIQIHYCHIVKREGGGEEGGKEGGRVGRRDPQGNNHLELLIVTMSYLAFGKGQTVS